MLFATFALLISTCKVVYGEPIASVCHGQGSEVETKNILAVPNNLLTNGAFQNEFQPDMQTHYTDSIKDWEVTRAELGRGLWYNSKWGETIVIELDVEQNTEYSIPLAMYQGSYSVVFDWASREGWPYDTSLIEVQWNKECVCTLTPSDDQIYSSVVIVKSMGNKDRLTFAGAGTSDGVGATLTNVRVFRRSNVVPKNNFASDLFSSHRQLNLITNGDFENVPFQMNGESYFSREELPGWTVQPQGKIKIGVLQGSDDDQVNHMIELHWKNNAEYTTHFDGIQQTYLVSFDFAPCKNHPLSTSKFSVLFNRQSIFQWSLTTYFFRRVFLKVDGKKGPNTLTFRGEGRFLNVGTTIDNVEVHLSRSKAPENEVPISEVKRATIDRGQFVQRRIPRNMISNGAFELEQLPMEKEKDVNQLQNWIVVGTGKIGQGSLYNQGWGDNAVVAELSKGVEYHLPLHLRKGNYTIQFDWAPREGKPRKSSLMLMKWNEYRVGQIIARSDQVLSITFVCRTNGKPNKFSLIGIGSSEDYGSAFTNFRVYQLQMTNYPLRARIYSCVLLLLEIEEDLIENGDFEFIPSFKVTDEELFIGQFIPGWDVKGQGEIGKGKMYNSDWNPQTNVVELDSNWNVEYATKIKGDQTQLILRFDYAPCMDQQLATSSLSISLNGKTTLNIIPDTYRVRRQIVELKFERGENNIIGFRGEGNSDGSGATIDNVEVRELK